jgi:Transposase IS4
MTTGHRIEPKVLRKRKRLKKTALNARITRESFRENPTKILSIPTLIDDYNHYMGGLDQSNQLRAAFTTHFSWNQKEFFPRAFWAINIAVYNSYKLHLALNGSKTLSTGKRDPRQHREWVEDLVNLLFQVDNDDFGEDISSKPYLKYNYQSVLKEPKRLEKKAFLRAINNSINHSYDLNLFRKKGYYCFCP